MPESHETTRRTQRERTGGRAATVVDRIVRATVEELSRVGYEAMRVEDVAARSGVNKTTIYRRWPTKAELVGAAVSEESRRHLPRKETGTLRGDLRASLLGAFELTPYEQGILRVIQTERALADVDALARRLRNELRDLRIAMVRRGIKRGELPVGVDAELVVDLVSAPVQRALLFNERMDGRAIDRVLDVVLAGAALDARAAASTEREPVSAGARKQRGARASKLTTQSATGTRPRSPRSR